MLKCALFALAAVAYLCSASAAEELPNAMGRQLKLINPEWKLFVPSTCEQRDDGSADVLVHFHGHPQTMWNNALQARLNVVIVTVNYKGLSSVYSKPFSDGKLFQSLLDDALTKLQAEPDFPNRLKWDKIAVTSFSAGYGAVREILKSGDYRDRITAVVAADSIYASTADDGTPVDEQMVDFKRLAKLAQAGEKTFLFSHSQVLTHTYENTMETGDELLQHLGLTAEPVTTKGLGTLQFYRHAHSGNFQLWGAVGDDGDAHMQHLRFMAEFLKELPLAKLP